MLLSGLPGDGKSYLARRLAEACGAEIVESDAVRLRLTGEPRFTPAEHRRVFDVCHALVERLLGEGRVVIMDATNLGGSTPPSGLRHRPNGPVRG